MLYEVITTPPKTNSQTRQAFLHRNGHSIQRPVDSVLSTAFHSGQKYKPLAGVLLAALFFANKIAHFLLVDSELDEAASLRRYRVRGQIFS